MSTAPAGAPPPPIELEDSPDLAERLARRNARKQRDRKPSKENPPLSLCVPDEDELSAAAVYLHLRACWRLWQRQSEAERSMVETEALVRARVAAGCLTLWKYYFARGAFVALLDHSIASVRRYDSPRLVPGDRTPNSHRSARRVQLVKAAHPPQTKWCSSE